MRKDLLFSDDIEFADGDFATGPSDEQHIEHILQSAPGHYKQHPLVGADITQMLGSGFGSAEKRQITIALQSDGYQLKSIKFSNDKIQIDAE
jgi:hypothetical protein